MEPEGLGTHPTSACRVTGNIHQRGHQWRRAQRGPPGPKGRKDDRLLWGASGLPFFFQNSIYLNKQLKRKIVCPFLVPPSPASSNQPSVLCIYELIFYDPHIRGIIWYLSFSV